MYGVTYDPAEQDNKEVSWEGFSIDPELENMWNSLHRGKITENTTSKVTEEPAPTKVNEALELVKRLEIGYLNPDDYKIPTSTTFSGNNDIRSALESEMERRGLDDTMKTFLRKSAVLESGMNLNPKNVPTGVHTGGANKGKRFRALGMWQILNTNLKGLPISDEATYMSSLSNQLDNVLAMHEKSRAWLRNSGYLEKGRKKGFTEDELLYLMHHGWTNAVINMVDKNKSIGDVVNGVDKGTAYTLSKYKQLKID